jgi:hypothetical protein
MGWCDVGVGADFPRAARISVFRRGTAREVSVIRARNPLNFDAICTGDYRFVGGARVA